MKIRNARLILMILAIAVLLGAYFGRQPVVTGWVSQGQSSDQDMHAEFVKQIKNGENYYNMCVTLLRKYGCATKPFFHWRLPTMFYSLALLPHVFIARIILATVAFVLIIQWTEDLKPVVGFYTAAIFSCLAGGPFVGLAFKTNFLFTPEIWAGVLIALSVVVHSKRPWLGIGLGLLALFIRELALPFVVLMMGWALYDGKRREAMIWGIGIIGFGLYLFIHALNVKAHLLPIDISDPTWIRFAGWPQAVACANWLFLGRAPYWLAGSALVLALFGCLYSRQYRLLSIIVTYTFAFAIAGKPHNHYWGIIYTPLLAVALAYSVDAMRQLVPVAIRKAVKPT